jgi:hypothetical protein
MDGYAKAHGLWPSLFFRLHYREDRVIKLPTISNDHKLLVVLSREELRRLFLASQRLKKRVLLGFIYLAVKALNPGKKSILKPHSSFATRG